jgi:hypothetical protein
MNRMPLVKKKRTTAAGKLSDFGVAGGLKMATIRWLCAGGTGGDSLK